MGYRKRLGVFLSLILIACAFNSNLAFGVDDPVGKEVSGIEIVGNKRVPESVIRQEIQNVKPGKIFSFSDVRKDVDRLKLTGKFSDVFATTKVVNGKVIVTFHIQEKPIITEIQFRGAKKISEKDLRDVLGFSEGDFLDEFKIRSAVESILQYYRDKGFTEASVELDDSELSDGIVIYNIVEGPRVRIRKIRFEGNKSFSDKRLSGEIHTKTYIWLIRSGAYKESQIQDDILALRNFYRRHGFLDAQVGRRLDYGPYRENLTVTFVINEGMQYTVGKIDIKGNKYFSKDDILNVMSLEPGSILNLDKLEADRRAILSLYGRAGFIYAKVNVNYVYSETPGVADLKINIKEGKSYKIGRIIIRGNERTQDRVVRRTLDFYPGDVYDVDKVNEHERHLYETRLFRDVKITPTVGLSDDERNVEIKVEETETTRFMAGVGITSNSGVLGSLSIESWNFDIFDWPRTWGEFFRGQAFKGAGQTMKISLEPGTEVSRFRIDFTEPYLFDRPLSLGLSGYLFDRDRDGYTEKRAGMMVSLGKRFKKIYTFRTAFRLENVKVDDIDYHYWFFAPKDILEAEGNNLLTSLKLSIIRDTTDSFFMPSRGTRMEASWELAGGDWEFSKLIGRITHYKTLRTDIFDRKTIWASNAVIGYISGDVPVFERFYGGGIGSIRGFAFRGVSPRQWPDNTQVGGNFELLVGNELSFPLAGKKLRGVTFLDMGTVEDDIGITDWRAAVGFGIRLVVDYFGPIPMAFDFAWPISKNDDDDTQVFSFSLGAAFR